MKLNPYAYSSRKIFLSLGILLCLIAISLTGWRADGTSREGLERPVATTASQAGKETLHGLLNPDGTLKPGVKGNFDVSGYRMESAANGTPRFVPATEAGCNGWDAQFTLPNGVNGAVRALAVNGNEIYVGGSFTGIGTLVANRVAKFNTTANTWSALVAGGNGVDDDVYALAFAGSDLYVGGIFSHANVGGAAITAYGLAKFNTVTNVWSAPGKDGNTNANVFALAVIGNELFAGGIFGSLGGSGGKFLARMNLTTGIWSSFGSPDYVVQSLAAIGNNLFVGGGFRSINTGSQIVNTNYVAKFDLTTGTWSALGSGNGNGANDSVFALAVMGNDLYVGGQFFAVNMGSASVSAAQVAKFNTTTNTWSALGTGGGNGVRPRSVYTLAVTGSDLYVAGDFTEANSGSSPISANNVAKFNTTTSVWSALGSGGGNGVNSYAYALAVVGNDLYVGGTHTQANPGGVPVAANYISKVDITAGAWSALNSSPGNGVNGVILAMLANGDDLYVGGSFNAVGPISANNIAKFNTATNTWSVLGSGGGNGVDREVRSLALVGSDLYVGGNFRHANIDGAAVSTNRIAKFNTTTGAWRALGSRGGNGVGLTTGPPPPAQFLNPTVSALAVIGNDLYVGGDFFGANIGSDVGVGAIRIAKFNTITNIWSTVGSHPGDGIGNPSLSSFGRVDDFVVKGSDLYLCGSFSSATANGVTINVSNLVKFDTLTSSWSKLGPDNGINYYPEALALIGNDLYAGGRFTSGPTSYPLARFNLLTNTVNLIGSADYDDGVNGYIRDLAVFGNELYAGGRFTRVNVNSTPITVNHVARFNPASNIWSALADPGGGGGIGGSPSPEIYTLSVSGNDLFAGGKFTIVGDNKVSTSIGRYCGGILSPPVITVEDPLGCTGPGDALIVTAVISNPNATAQTVNFTASPNVAGQLTVVPNTCSVSNTLSGACTTTASQVTFTGSLAAGQTATIRYQVQVGDQVAAGTHSCVTSTVTNGPSTASVTACGTVNCPAVGPGLLPQTTSPAGGQKTGSVLIYNVYTSASDPTRQNTRLNLTNTHPALSANVHLFFVDGTSCSVADSFLCLTANQTSSFLASDIDPGSTGYLVAVATDAQGCPINFNYLIGDEYVKFQSGHTANLGAEAIAALAGGLPSCDNNASTAVLRFDGVSYNVLPRTLALDNLPSRADGNDTLLILNRIGGNLGIGAETLGAIFGILYDDVEASLSFSLSDGCQLRGSLTNTFPRTAPRLENFIPAGRSGWIKLYSQNDVGMTGAAINFNGNVAGTAGAFNQGHNLHVLTSTAAMVYTIPVFPPNC